MMAALKGRDGFVYLDALGVRVEAGDLFTCPDFSVVCGEPAVFDAGRTTLLNPTALVEVLSPSTETDDRTTTTRFYRRIPSLEVVRLVSQDAPAVDVRTRDGWHLAAAADGRVSVGPPGVALALDEIHDGVAFPAPGSRDRPSLGPPADA